MSKAIEGAAAFGGAVLLGATAFVLASTGIGLAALPFLMNASFALATLGAGLEAGAIAEALTSGSSSGYTVRQPAPFRQIIYGEQRVGGVYAYLSTTGSKLSQNNYIIVLAGHQVDSIVNLYLDGRQVFWNVGSHGNTTRNGVNFGGSANGSTYTGPGGAHYNFGTLVYCEPRFGDQTPTSAGPSFPGGWTGNLVTGNDTLWDSSAPLLMGCTYVYLKLEYDVAMFPNSPFGVEVKFTIRGKNDIWDPRTGTKGYSTNPALICADVILDPQQLGDEDAFKDAGSVAQLIAAANVCDAPIFVEATGSNEAQYSCHYHYQTSTTPGDTLVAIMQSMGGRLSMPGGEYYFFPAYWQGPSFSFDAGALAGPLQWTGRSLKDLFNRVNGTYIAPNWPWNTAGNLYDANGFFNGTIQNNFAFGFTPASYPQYASDPNHGYATDAYLEEDSQLLGPYVAGTSYALGDVVKAGGVMYKSLIAANLGNTPASSPADWAPYSNLLPMELTLRSVLSVTQAQRLAKIALLRNRFQGSGTLAMMQKGFVMQACDVMSFTFPAMNWSSKTLEVVGASSSIEYGDGKTAPREKLSMKVGETDISIYLWDPATEEKTVYGESPSTVYSGYPAPPPALPGSIAAPTGLTLSSSSATAILGLDGINRPRILAVWAAPADARVTQIQLQFQVVGAGSWTDVGAVSAASTQAFLSSVVAGQNYNVQIRSLAYNGATSAWVAAGPVTASAPNSLVASYSNSPQYPLTNPTSTTIAIAATAVTFGNTTVNYAARTKTISAPGSATLYYLTIADPTQVGESGSPTLTVAASTSNSLVGVQGNTYLGAITVLPAGGGTIALPGGWPAPTGFQVVS